MFGGSAACHEESVFESVETRVSSSTGDRGLFTVCMLRLLTWIRMRLSLIISARSGAVVGTAESDGDINSPGFRRR